jgi:hypothetical protein
MLLVNCPMTPPLLVVVDDVFTSFVFELLLFDMDGIVENVFSNDKCPSDEPLLIIFVGNDVSKRSLSDTVERDINGDG